MVVVDGGGGRRGGAERDPVLGRRQPPPLGVRRRERHQSGRELPAAINGSTFYMLHDRTSFRGTTAGLNYRLDIL